MMDFNHQKIIALIIGVLVLAIATNYIAFAWNAPPSFSLPIDVSDNSQTKAGALTVASFSTSELDTTNNQIFLNTSGNEGDIYNINSIKGYDDMRLWSESSEKATIYLEEAEGIKFYTNNAPEPRMTVGSNNSVYTPALTGPSSEGCFLRVDAAGKLECYSGGNPPDGKFRSTQAEIMRLYITDSTDFCFGFPAVCTENPVEDFRAVINEEAVVKITMNLASVEKSTEASNCGTDVPYIKFYFYIKENGSSVWDLKESLEFTANCWVKDNGFFPDDCICDAGSNSETWYYHLKQGDEIKITTQIFEGKYANLTSEVLGYNLTFKRQVVNYVFTNPGHNVLHYFSKNTTGEMSSTPEAYWVPTPASMAVTADNAPITIIRQISP